MTVAYQTADDEPAPDQAEFHARWRAWRDAREAELRQPYGTLSATGLHWLSDEWQSFDRVPGRWRVADSDVQVDARAEEGLRLEAVLVDGPVGLGLGRSASIPVLTAGALHLSVSAFPASNGRGAQYAVRSHDPHSETLTGFTGVPTYDPDFRWVVRARYEPYSSPRPITLDTVVDSLHKDLALIGAVRFHLFDAEHTLEVYSAPFGELHIPFRDRTNGITTYPVRVVRAQLPQDQAREFVLDFNRAANGPCGLTPFATCALPPAGNTLPFAVEAGEKLPPWRDDLPYRA
ncbi:DUF1684 domain-containing protein [Frankia gtarii]|uniref:DUF1684 domain-containing protein n=1 Tax=Frankia gtarii TaxID=2950102 RepID=UPI0021C0BCCC|nr:DUF1684 domain-containing protein [Frankia gtarii]